MQYNDKAELLARFSPVCSNALLCVELLKQVAGWRIATAQPVKIAATRGRRAQRVSGFTAGDVTGIIKIEDISMREKELKYHAKLDMTAIVSDQRDSHNSLSTGTIIEITQRGIRIERGDGSNDFIKWANVREINNT